MPGISSVVPAGGRVVEIYCDESLDRGGYDLIGGVWVTPAQASKLRRKIAHLRTVHRYPHEFKFKKSGGRLSPVYSELVPVLGDHFASGHNGAFNCIAVKRSEVDFGRYHEGSKELGFYKFYTLLLCKRVRPGETYLLYVDERSDRVSTRLMDMRDVVNAASRRDLRLGYDCVRDVQARDSVTDELVQVADVLLGAVGYHVGGLHLRPGMSQAKAELADRLARRLGRPSLAVPSSPWQVGFNVWVWTPGTPKVAR
jgi:hypothetical protein